MGGSSERCARSPEALGLGYFFAAGHSVQTARLPFSFEEWEMSPVYGKRSHDQRSPTRLFASETKRTAPGTKTSALPAPSGHRSTKPAVPDAIFHGTNPAKEKGDDGRRRHIAPNPPKNFMKSHSIAAPARDLGAARKVTIVPWDEVRLDILIRTRGVDLNPSRGGHPAAPRRRRRRTSRRGPRGG